MSNKHLKKLKELQRLQALHQTANTSAPTAVRQLADSSVQSPIIAKEPSAEMIANNSHTTVKRDLVVLVPLLVSMTALLFVAKWTVEHTALTQWILSAGRLFN
ncbi:hypothetical protein A3K24_01200 [candidate division Kazan bacterium RIFCSPHIGHO2_01_FULL_44_14]|uniref:Uncharacterized protein n=1 Tax=candidate division Kazan bacterium RIFCSPLOWO2_01_FULL_45_19 TaxID=1798538 RepID=A0A1F4NPS6_UNCK3|nr:hypothetical protein [uncultured bacterium]OGB73463.1 MAG: hypothetical protein A3K51_01200 [candidate division Kazan bacterium RIFCSPLOWO2_01_FULL_45_19]OGB77708.1 MAG: hypothetical protein A3K24_01200 [candidate division Kazan bacterium RIFCSPHIGHO2_01_FULL_44_14]